MYTITSLATKLRAKEISSVELTSEYLSRIEHSTTNAYISIIAEQALEMAQRADAQLTSGDAHPLCGIPFALKDLFNAQGTITSAGSKILANFTSPFNATVSTNLLNTGAVLLGKTNLDEFAMGSANDTSYYGAVKNPWNHTHIAGGSSGGSAAAVAQDLCAFATGTDTGGSIRQPASMCGITGIKPTYGRVSRYGIVAYASSLDQAGPMAKTAKDCAIILQAMSSFDERDSTSSTQSIPDFSAQLGSGVAGLKIGVPKEYFADGLDNEVAKCITDAIAQYEKMGAIISEISLPNLQNSIPAYYIIAPSEASSNLSRYDGARYGYRCDKPKNLEDMYVRTRTEGFGIETQKRIMVGTYALSEGYYDAYYLKAQRVRRLVAEDFHTAFNTVDVIMGPVAPTPAWQFGTMKDSTQMYLSDIYTLGVNLAGLPAMSIPCGLAQGLPVGLHLIAKPWAEAELLATAHAFQQATDFHTLTPGEQQ